MRGYLIVGLLAVWPLLLVVAVLYLTMEGVAVALTSAALPALMVSVACAVGGLACAGMAAWRALSDRDGEVRSMEDLRLSSFRATLALYAVSVAALALAISLTGIAF